MTRSTIQKFGSAHTPKKLAKLESYLHSYTTAMKNQNFHTVYVDAFAGTGGVEIRGDPMPLLNIFESRQFVEGSIRRALKLSNPFDEYIFVERDKAKVAELSKVVDTEFPHLRDRVRIVLGDANDIVSKFCEERNWHRRGSKQTRAVVFLDPCGNSVSWQTLELIARTQAIDLWYLFPAGWGVHRQIGGDGTVHFTHEASIIGFTGERTGSKRHLKRFNSFHYLAWRDLRLRKKQLPLP